MNLQPIGNRVFIKRDEAAKKVGLLHIPDSAQNQQKQTQGVIVAAGEGVALNDGRIRPLEVKVGDRVLFNAYQGTEVTIEDETLLSIREDDILAIIES